MTYTVPMSEQPQDFPPQEHGYRTDMTMGAEVAARLITEARAAGAAEVRERVTPPLAALLRSTYRDDLADEAHAALIAGVNAVRAALGGDA
jgi:hypothetical protein